MTATSIVASHPTKPVGQLSRCTSLLVLTRHMLAAAILLRPQMYRLSSVGEREDEIASEYDSHRTGQYRLEALRFALEGSGHVCSELTAVSQSRYEGEERPLSPLGKHGPTHDQQHAQYSEGEVQSAEKAYGMSEDGKQG